MKIVVIPDVHGRPFWKRAVPLLNDVDFMVFLGDYLDQPKTSPLTNAQCIDNFEEIIDFAKQNTKVKLLLGNHDFHYIVDGTKYTGYRSSYKYKFRELYRIDTKLFSFHFGLRAFDNTANIVFSHAGILPSWFQKVCDSVQQFDLFVEPVTQQTLVSCLDNVIPVVAKSRLIRALDDCGPIRGGTSPVGSLIWADKSELEHWHCTQDNFGQTIQVVGHTSVAEPTGVFSSDHRGVLFLDCWDYTNDIVQIDLSTTFSWRKV